MTFRVAVVAAACEFPESRSVEELWDTVLHRRRCFRPMSTSRLAMSDYARGSGDPDSFDALEAGLISNYLFDRARFRVPQSSYDRTDLAHWLALDVATRALQQLGSTEFIAVRDNMAVIVANTLTGEMSRAQALRYRWPYIERVVRTGLRDGMNPDEIKILMSGIEANFKAPFPVPDEDSLSGALANTIAGRIANHHGARGGAYTVDGACASSLVAVASAFDMLASGNLECVLVGAVDVSLDPFELVGFARNGALAPGLMRVFDRDSSGFWPGEGCGFVILATETVAARHNWPVIGWIRAAALSSDGAGGLTTPTSSGQTLASHRAWNRAECDPLLADYFEAHGTGTSVGDPIELAGLHALMDGRVPSRPIPVGSVKANIGHTKAAAGMAGLLKALAMCRHRVIPATSGCLNAHPVFDTEVGQSLAVRSRAQPVSHQRPMTIGINSFGFGGINCHVVLEGLAPSADFVPTIIPEADAEALSGELFQLAAPDPVALIASLQQLGRRAGTLSRAEFADLAWSMAPGDAHAWRACVVALDPADLKEAANAAAISLGAAGTSTRILSDRFSWSAPAPGAARIALLFPGQGGDVEWLPERWGRRFGVMQEAARFSAALLRGDISDTAVLQPLLAETALAGLELLRKAGLHGDVMLGHSFGELPALHAAGCCSADELRRLARERGACMSEHAAVGAMLSLRAERGVVDALMQRYDLDLACDNGTRSYVLAGPVKLVEEALAECAAQAIPAARLPTARAFHSRGMVHAAAVFGNCTRELAWQQARTEIISSITGSVLDAAACIPSLLFQQLTTGVQFGRALDQLGQPDLILEVGAGRMLTHLTEERYGGRVMALDIFGATPIPLLGALGAAWVCGGALDHDALYKGRHLRTCLVDAVPSFFTNPCGVLDEVSTLPAVAPTASVLALPQQGSTRDAVVAAVAELTGLPIQGLDPTLRLLTDLHLNSIRARHAVALAGQRLGLARMPFDLARLADASLDEAADYLDTLRNAPAGQTAVFAKGVAPWWRFYSHAWQAGAPSDVQSTLPPVMVDDTLCPIGQDCAALLTPVAPEAACCMLLVLPAVPDTASVAALLRAVQRVQATPQWRGLLVLQGAQLCNGFLRSVAAELPDTRWCAVEYATLDATTLSLAIREFCFAAYGYGEIRCRGAEVQRRAMVLAALPLELELPVLQAGAVLLVSGGGRGIGAVSAAALAERYRCSLALVGRSAAESDEVAGTLAQLRAKGHMAHYYQADLADASQARSVVARIENDMGPVRAILHAAGVNSPSRVGHLNAELITATLAGKVLGLAALLECVPPAQLQLVIGYGSIIGELGLAGEAHYALANEWLGCHMQQLANALPTCRVLCLAWTAWAEAGMATHIDGTLDGLRDAGTRALENDEACAALLHAVQRDSPVRMIVSGRYGRRITAADALLVQGHRYLERLLLFYPGVELVAEAKLSGDTDRYLGDHAPFGIPVLPLVCAIEALVSAARCLQGASGRPVIEGLRIGESMACAPGKPLIIRTSALRLADGSVRAELTAESTAYEVVHFSALLRWDTIACAAPILRRDGVDNWSAPVLLYRGLCFHGTRFARLATITQLCFDRCQACIAPVQSQDWYGPWLAPHFAAGIPAIRDAALHSLQVCVPHQVVLPVAVAEIRLGVLDPDTAYTVSARQLAGDGARFVFDIEISTASGTVVECWRGLELRRAGAGYAERRVVLAPPLLEPLIGRLLHDELGVCGAQVGVVVGPARRLATSLALSRALDARGCDYGRSDATPEVAASATHAGAITIALSECSSHRLAIDLQWSPDYSSEEWQLMLGESRRDFALMLADQAMLPPAMAMLYTWTLSECLIKLGVADWPLANAVRTSIDTAMAGVMLRFDCSTLCLLVVHVQLDSDDGPASAVLALAAAPRAAAGVSQFAGQFATGRLS